MHDIDDSVRLKHHRLHQHRRAPRCKRQIRSMDRSSIPVGPTLHHFARRTCANSADRLTQGTFVLIGGRLGAIYGHKNLVMGATVWFVVFQLIAGFMRNIISLSVMRALTGIGAGLAMPNAIALITITFPPGRMRNVTVGLFGAMAPVGAAGGSVFAGFFGQLLPWWWLFFFL
jgi:MFS family permease